MFDFKSVMLPALIGVFGGLFGPILVEKWKGSEEGSKNQIVIEQRLQKLEEKVNSFSSGIEDRMTSMENNLKNIELNISRNTGVLKGKLPDIPLEVIPSD
ncbi:MAG: hypothetical protein V4544_02780 [Pseudomonadota bacterium]